MGMTFGSTWAMIDLVGYPTTMEDGVFGAVSAYPYTHSFEFELAPRLPRCLRSGYLPRINCIRIAYLDQIAVSIT